MTRKPKMLTWTVEFSVSENWVADGFEADDEWAQSVIEECLGYAYPEEVRGRVVKAPEPEAIRKLQGTA